MNIRLAAIATCLLSTTAWAQTPAPQSDAPTVPNNPDYSAVVGRKADRQPLE